MFAPFCSGPSRPSLIEAATQTGNSLEKIYVQFVAGSFERRVHSIQNVKHREVKDKIGRDTILCGTLDANPANTANIGAFTNSLHPLSPLSAGFLTAQSSRQPPNAKVTPAVAPALEFANLLRLLSLLK
jgi:hypothetical protein